MAVVYVADFSIGALVKEIEQITRLTATRELNRVGAIEIVSSDINLANLTVGNVLTVTTEDEIFNRYLIKKIEIASDLVRIVGQDYGCFLDNRIVAYPAGSPQSSKTGAADDILRIVVYENLTGGASSERSVSSYGIDVEGALSLCSVISLSFAWDLLRNVVDKIVAVAHANGERIFWSFVPKESSSTGATFIVRKNNLFGTLPEPKIYTKQFREIAILTKDYSVAVNAVYAGGTGEGSSRAIQVQTLSHTPMTRVERFYDLSHVSSSTELQNAAKSKLSPESVAVKATSVELPETVFGKTVNVGLFDQSFSLICNEVEIRQSGSDKHTVVTEWESL